MAETLILLVSSFWLGAVHAATPGHGKTIAAAYIVGARGRPVDALVLGIFVTLSHTSGIVLVAILASLGSSWLIPHRVEAYLAMATGLLVVAIGAWMLVSQRAALRAVGAESGHRGSAARGAGHGGSAEEQGHSHGPGHGGSADEHGHSHGPGPDQHWHSHGDGPDQHGHSHPRGGDPGDHAHGDAGVGAHPHAGAEHGQALARAEAEDDAGYHSHGWGRRHTHRLDVVADRRPSLPVLLGLGIAGGLLPDPGALAILLAAIASGRVVLGLFVVVVFSIGFASVLVVVGIVAARVGQVVLAWLQGPWVARLQIAAALVIVVVGAVLTAMAWRTLTRL